MLLMSDAGAVMVTVMFTPLLLTSCNRRRAGLEDTGVLVKSMLTPGGSVKSAGCTPVTQMGEFSTD